MSVLLSDLWWQCLLDYGTPALQSAATGGGTTTIIDTAALTAVYADDYWINGWAYILTDAGGTGAAPQGEIRRISDFVSSSGTITVPSAFTAAVVATDTYRLWTGVPKVDALDAAKAALREAYPAFFQRYVDETLTLTASTFEYTVPATIEHVSEVWYQGDSGATYYTPVQGWRIIKSGASTRKLILDQSITITAGYELRLIGRGPLDCPAADATALTIEAEYEDTIRQFVGLYGAGWLHQRMMVRDSGNASVHKQMRDDLMKQARAVKMRAMPQPAGRLVVEVPDYWR